MPLWIGFNSLLGSRQDSSVRWIVNETVIFATVKKQKPPHVHCDPLRSLVVDDLPGHDVDDLLGMREADPGQVCPHRPGEPLASQLCPLCRLRIRPQWEMLLKGREDLLQDWFLQVCSDVLWISFGPIASPTITDLQDLNSIELFYRWITMKLCSTRNFYPFYQIKMWNGFELFFIQFTKYLSIITRFSFVKPSNLVAGGHI